MLSLVSMGGLLRVRDAWVDPDAHQVDRQVCDRNQEGEDSLESTIQREGTTLCLPVFTLADPEQVRRSREHADRVVAKLLNYLIDLDNVRGTGRLYLP